MAELAYPPRRTAFLGGGIPLHHPHAEQRVDAGGRRQSSRRGRRGGRRKGKEEEKRGALDVVTAVVRRGQYQAGAPATAAQPRGRKYELQQHPRAAAEQMFPPEADRDWRRPSPIPIAPPGRKECAECEAAAAEGRDVPFHSCVRDTITVAFRSSAGPIRRPSAFA